MGKGTSTCCKANQRSVKTAKSLKAAKREKRKALGLEQKHKTEVANLVRRTTKAKKRAERASRLALKERLAKQVELDAAAIGMEVEANPAVKRQKKKKSKAPAAGGATDEDAMEM